MPLLNSLYMQHPPLIQDPDRPTKSGAASNALGVRYDDIEPERRAGRRAAGRITRILQAFQHLQVSCPSPMKQAATVLTPCRTYNDLLKIIEAHFIAGVRRSAFLAVIRKL